MPLVRAVEAAFGLAEGTCQVLDFVMRCNHPARTVWLRALPQQLIHRVLLSDSPLLKLLEHMRLLCE